MIGQSIVPVELIIHVIVRRNVVIATHVIIAHVCVAHDLARLTVRVASLEHRLLTSQRHAHRVSAHRI
jgi:hypothetical protein